MDELRDELRWVRGQLEALALARMTGSFSEQDLAKYEELCREETVLIGRVELATLGELAGIS
jgi:DNA-binding GntR family transcriptional regulator